MIRVWPLAHRRRAAFHISAALAFCSLSLLAAGAEESTNGSIHALLINGGHRPESNYLSHFHHLEDMVDLLKERGVAPERIHIFSADGEDVAADLAVRKTKTSDFWLIEGTQLGRRLSPPTQLTNSEWPGVTVHPAQKDALRAWFEKAGKDFLPGERLLVFVTDHGTRNREEPDNGAISLWKEELTVRELNELLGFLPRGVQVVMTMSQCYSGTFANTMYANSSSEPSGDVCGFFSTTRDLRAYGCYAEGRDRDKMGHAFRFIDALGRRGTTVGAHHEVLVTDDTPDVPLSTSDLYLERLVSDEAAERDVDKSVLVDSLLKEAWLRPDIWEPEITLVDQIANAYGLLSPRSLHELNRHASELATLGSQFKIYTKTWNTALANVKEFALTSFLDEQPEWRPRVEKEAVESMDPESHAALVSELITQFGAYVRNRDDIWRRLERLSENTRRGSEAEWRSDVRTAAIARMRSILTAIAARVLLEQGTASEEERVPRVAQRQAFNRLQQCEALTLGNSPTTSAAVDQVPSVVPFPALADEIALKEEIVPSWLGVSFVPASRSLQVERQLPVGVSLIQAVYPGSPAQEAGLIAGDIVLGPPGRPFHFPDQVREWALFSPRGVPSPLRVLRPGDLHPDDRELEVNLVFQPYPLKLPELPQQVQVGDQAPALPPGLEPVGSPALPELSGRPHLLFFWATWCVPCKRAVPEVMAFAEARALPVLAVSDEDVDTVAGYLEGLGPTFFQWVAVDRLRKSFVAYGVNGTPTIVLVDEEGVVRNHQVGYDASRGLMVEGWSWSR